MKPSTIQLNTPLLSGIVRKSRTYLISFFRIINLEVIIWSVALIFLALFNGTDNSHFTICPLSNLGFENCPGCGLGKSITMFFNGNFLGSIYTHLLGIPAVVILIYRIITLTRNNILTQRKINIKERTNHA